VLSGATSDGNRTQESQKLLNWGFQNFDTVKLYSKGPGDRHAGSVEGFESTVKIGFPNDVLVTVPKGVAAKMKPVLERKDPLVAPLAANGRVGTLKMMVDGKPLLALPVVSLEEVSGSDLRPRLGFDAPLDARASAPLPAAIRRGPCWRRPAGTSTPSGRGIAGYVPAP
jgi:D-alanyl-D-alanine carboxypeptidase (penicillin-binding protein 5/6)